MVSSRDGAHAVVVREAQHHGSNYREISHVCGRGVDGRLRLETGVVELVAVGTISVCALKEVAFPIQKYLFWMLAGWQWQGGVASGGGCTRR